MSKKIIRPAIRKILQQFGYDIIKTNPVFTKGNLNKKLLLKEYAWLIEYDFKTIIDIGANEGQFTEKMRILFPDATIIAFEPIPETFQRLQFNFSNDSRIKLLNYGLGNTTGVTSFNLNNITDSSSFLEMNELHLNHFQKATPKETIKVYIEKLDDVLIDHEIKYPLLVKIDVQGFEKEVILGGMNTIRKANAVISELSFKTLYNNQPLFDDIYKLLIQAGFSYAGNLEQLHSPDNNLILQADGFFTKQS